MQFSLNTTVCPTTPALSEDGALPLFGKTTFHQLALYVTGGCCLVSLILSYWLMNMHALHYSKPNEQLKIMKIIVYVIVYAAITFASVASPTASIYMQPWLEVAQASALATFFLLLCEYISPSEDQRTLFFAGLEIPASTKGMFSCFGPKKTYRTAEQRIAWYKMRWFAIFQYPVLAFLIAIVINVTQAFDKYCTGEIDPHFSYIFTELIMSASTGTALVSIFHMWKLLSQKLKEHKTLSKIGALKIIVFFNFIIGIVFAGLKLAKVLNPSDKLTYADLTIGLPNLILAVSLVPSGLFFNWAYSYKPYVISKEHQPLTSSTETDDRPQRYYGGFMGHKALLACLNPTEILQSIRFGLQMGVEYGQYMKQVDNAYQNNMEGQVEYLEPLRAGKSGSPVQGMSGGQGRGPLRGGRGHGHAGYTQQPQYDSPQYAPQQQYQAYGPENVYGDGA